MNKQKHELYFDMDDVIYPLQEIVIDQFNKDYNQNFDWKKNAEYWWGSTNAPRSYFEEVLQRPGIFINAKPDKETIDYIFKLHEEGYPIKILTAPQWTANCMSEKVEFIKEYLQFIDINKDLIFCGDKGLIAKPNRVLVDDNKGNTNCWEKNGGIAIPYGGYGWTAKTKNSCNNMKEVYDLIHKIS